MTTQDSMTNEQRLTLITDMINKARFNFSRGSFYFILWGVILFGAAVYEYLAGSVFDLSMPWIGWPIAGMLGGIFSALYSRKVIQRWPDHPFGQDLFLDLDGLLRHPDHTHRGLGCLIASARVATS